MQRVYSYVFSILLFYSCWHVSSLRGRWSKSVDYHTRKGIPQITAIHPLYSNCFNNYRSGSYTCIVFILTITAELCIDAANSFLSLLQTTVSSESKWWLTGEILWPRQVVADPLMNNGKFRKVHRSTIMEENEQNFFGYRFAHRHDNWQMRVQ